MMNFRGMMLQAGFIENTRYLYFKGTGRLNDITLIFGGATRDQSLDAAKQEVINRGISEEAFTKCLEGEEAFNKCLKTTLPEMPLQEDDLGPARDKSVDQFVDFLQSEGGSLLRRIQRELARVSPVDPIAGNPNSLQSTLVASAFDDGISGKLAPVKNNRLGIGLTGGTFKSASYRGSNITLPLSYQIEFGEGSSRKQLKFNLPVTYLQVEGGDVLSTSPGFSLTVPVDDHWSLTPAVNYGLTGSIDLGSVGQMIGGTLTSRYEFNPSIKGMQKVILGNMIGYVSTLKFSIEGIEYDPGIINTVYKNGITVESPLGFQLFEKHPVTMQTSYAYSYFAGTKLFLNQYHEVALDVGSGWDAPDWLPSNLQELRVGVAYTFGGDYDSLTGNLGYSF